MPKMTRAGFAAEVDRIWNLARSNFERDRRLHGAIIAYDAMGRQAMFLALTAEDYDNVEERKKTERSGVVPIRGDFAENAEAMSRIFREGRMVAAVRVSEAWSAEDDVAADVMALHMSPGEHPMSREVALACGFWPREHFIAYYTAEIVRDDRGENPVLGPTRRLDDEQAMVESWLWEALPQPY